MNIDKDIKDLEKYISFSKKDENFSNITDYVWHRELGEKIERTLSELETYKKIAEERIKSDLRVFAYCLNELELEQRAEELIEKLRKEVENE